MSEDGVDATDLAWAVRLGRVLLEARADVDLLAPPEAERRRAEIDGVFRSSPVALAYFRGPRHEMELASVPWIALFGDTAVVALRDAFHSVLRSGTSMRFETLMFRTTAGLERACRVRIAPVCDGLVVACTDLTEDIIEQRLGVSVPALAWSGPDVGQGDFFNARWCAYTGQTLEVAQSSDWRAWVHADDLPRLVPPPVVPKDVDVRLRRHDGEYRWHRLRFVLETGRCYGAAYDVHDAQRAEAERILLLDRERAARADAERANKLKDQFLATVSHELRAPVTTMMLWEQVLREDGDSAELRGRALDAIRESAATQSRLVGDLLDVSRAIAGKLHLDKRKIGVDGVLGSAVEALLPLAGAKQVAVRFDAPRRLGRVLADPARLRQIFDNLMSNAVKFTPPGGSIMISARREGGSIVIAISDTGRGIAPELMPRLFEPFTQADDVLTRSQGGLGLGLAIARQLVELHDGTLQASSAGPEQGATFTIALPAMNRRISTPTGTPPARVPRLDGIRVLVIDDDGELRAALVELLQRTGALVEAAAGPADARLALARALPHAILCDVAMPGEDGYSFIRSLRASDVPARDIPAIALTAYATAADRERAAAAGFDAHIAKPFGFERLALAVHQIIGARRTPP